MNERDNPLSIGREPSYDLTTQTTERADVRSIVINGQRRQVLGSEVTHDQLVRLAYPQTRPDAGSSFTVTYSGGPLGSPEGILSPFERTQIASGEAFNVALTDKS